MPRTLTRRSFLAGACGAAMSLVNSRLTSLAVSIPHDSTTYSQERLVVVFLRGGWDALNVVPPIGGADRGYYQQERPNLQIPTSGTGAALNLNGQFGLHPAMAPLHALYQAGKLAIIHAAGLTSDTRSHFDAMQFMELGTPGVKTTATGWLTRHLQSAPNLPPTIVLPALSSGGTQAMSLLGTTDAVSMSGPSGFQLSGHWQYEELQRAALRDLYSGATWLDAAGTETLDMVDLIESTNPGTYTPANGAAYPGGSLGNHLQTIAQLIKMQVGLRVATLDLGGWDTHERQGDGSTGYFADSLLKPLAEGLAALYTDLDGPCGSDYNNHTVIVVMSEFGRRLKENANRGTDHGHGSAMFVLGGSVRGGRVYGQWPGLRNDQLYDRADLAITTDYRRVLSEILVRRMGNPNITTVFPGYTGYTPLDIVTGPYPPPVPIPPGLNRKLFLPQVAQPDGDVCP